MVFVTSDASPEVAVAALLEYTKSTKAAALLGRRLQGDAAGPCSALSWHHMGVVARDTAQAAASSALSVGLSRRQAERIAGFVASAVVTAVHGSDAEAAAAAAAAARAAGADDSAALQLAVTAELVDKLVDKGPSVSALETARHASSTVLRSGGSLTYAAELATAAAQAAAARGLAAASALGGGRFNMTQTAQLVHGLLGSAAAAVAVLDSNSALGQLEHDRIAKAAQFAATAAHALVSGDASALGAEQSLSTHTAVQSHHNYEHSLLAELHLPKWCPDAPIPQHGLGVGLGWDTNEVGTAISFHCHFGYRLAGSDRRTCRHD